MYKNISYAGVIVKVRNIIAEDVEAYFEGSRTIEEVMDLIQGRVSLYVSENYYYRAILSITSLLLKGYFFGFLSERSSQNRSIGLKSI